ncbi:MAG: glycoside hydrolase family 88 protein [Lachnospiraceae bacterium]|nr:glycoside hydrolase family 88 protein [Lachnospiraceae bacterium]
MRKNERFMAEEIARRIVEKERIVAARSGEKIPYRTVDGIFDDNSGTDRIGWWTNGFYGGLMWLLYEYSGEDIFRQRAEGIEEKLDRNLMQYGGMDHDSGFKWLLTSVMDHKLCGNKDSKNRALLAAANLAGRFNPAGRFIRAWNDWSDSEIGQKAGWAIIDCMMNLPLLYWAGNETKDPRFTQIAMLHADTAIDAFVRENGSVCHIVCFDPSTGKRLGSLGGQGKEHGSSWTRGQAWALYGFAMSYRFTREKRYLETAGKIAAYVLGELEKWEYVPVDFWQEHDIDWEDSTAAAIFACGLLELENAVKPARTDDPEQTGKQDETGNREQTGKQDETGNREQAKAAENEKARQYHDAAVSLLGRLADNRCNWDSGTDNITEKCTAAYNDREHNFTIIYGDYYFAEGILRLLGKEPAFLR